MIRELKGPGYYGRQPFAETFQRFSAYYLEIFSSIMAISRNQKEYISTPFLLLDRILHFGDVVARVHVIRALEMHLVG
jgi:hypothetical protein